MTTNLIASNPTAVRSTMEMALWERTPDGLQFNDPRESDRLPVRIAGHIAFIPFIPVAILGGVFFLVWVAAAIALATIPGGLICALLFGIRLADLGLIYAVALVIVVAGALVGIASGLVTGGLDRVLRRRQSEEP